MKIIVVCELKTHLAKIYAALGDMEASPVVLHAVDCIAAQQTLSKVRDIGLVLVDSSLASARQAEDFHELRIAQPSIPFLMVSALTDRQHIRSAVEEVRSRAVLESPAAQAFLKSLLATLPGQPSQAVADRISEAPMPAVTQVSQLSQLSQVSQVSQECGELSARAAASVTQDQFAALTSRQREVLRLMCDGKSNKEIGNALDISEGTVKVHCRAIFRELGVRTRMGAASRVINGLP